MVRVGQGKQDPSSGSAGGLRLKLLARQMSSSANNPKGAAIQCLVDDDLEGFRESLAVLSKTPVSEAQRKKARKSRTDSYEAAGSGEQEGLNSFPLPRDHDINQTCPPDFDDKTLLFLCMEEAIGEASKDAEFCRALVAAGAKADLYSDRLGMAPIHAAILWESPGHVRALLENPENRADVDAAMQRSGQTAVHLAAAAGSSEEGLAILGLVLEHSRKPDAQDFQGGRTPLYMALTEAKSKEATEMLLKSGANADVKIGSMSVADRIKQDFPDLADALQRPSKKNPVVVSVASLFDRISSADLTGFSRDIFFLCGGGGTPSGEAAQQRQILSTETRGGYTLMQSAAMEGLHDFVRVLLEHGVDPNMVTHGQVHRRPVLFAAENGFWKVLEVFRDAARYGEVRGSAIATNFAVWTPDSHETVLHLVLRRSRWLGQRALHGNQANSHDEAKPSHGSSGCSDYGLSMEVLLSCVSCSAADEGPGSFARQIRAIVNKCDRDLNTPLHLAVLGWSEDTVRNLLRLGANVGLKNLRGETPLSRISAESLKQFLDEDCLVSSGMGCGREFKKPCHLEEPPDKSPVSGGDHDDDNMDLIDPKLVVSINQSEVTFKYGFLAPPVREDQLRNWRPQDQEELEERGDLPRETDTVWCLSQSPAHRGLVTHPVITSFLWIKWKRMRKFFNRDLRTTILYVFCLTWFIFSEFGGKADRSDSSEESRFCKDLPDYSFKSLYDRSSGQGDPPTSRTGFWYGLFWCQAVVQIFMILRDWRRELSFKLGGLSDRWSKGDGARRLLQGAGTFFRAFFVVWIDLLTLVLISLVLVGGAGVLWFVISVLFAVSAVQELQQALFSLSWYLGNPDNKRDVLLLVLVGVVMYTPNSSLPDPSTYSLEIGDGGPPPGDGGCSVKRCLAAAVLLVSWGGLLINIARHPVLDRYNVYVTMFYKVTTSFLRFMVWYFFFIVAFGLGFYIMLHQHDDATEAKAEPEVEASTTNEGTNGCPAVCAAPPEDKYVFFDSPWLALVKTSVMFVGEIEFSDIPVSGGNVSVTLAYVFLMAFVFLIVMVLMNLLNGLAVSDIGQILQEAEIVSNVARITTLAYFESVILGSPKDAGGGVLPDGSHEGCSGLNLLSRPLSCCDLLFKVVPSVRRWLQKAMGYSEMFLFFNFLKEKQLTLPLTSAGPCCCAALNCMECGGSPAGSSWELNNTLQGVLLDHENSGCQGILEHARRIIIENEKNRAASRRLAWKERRTEASLKEHSKALQTLISQQAQILHELSQLRAAMASRNK